MVLGQAVRAATCRHAKGVGGHSTRRAAVDTRVTRANDAESRALQLKLTNSVIVDDRNTHNIIKYDTFRTFISPS